MAPKWRQPKRKRETQELTKWNERTADKKITLNVLSLASPVTEVCLKKAKSSHSKNSRSDLAENRTYDNLTQESFRLKAGATINLHRENRQILLDLPNKPRVMGLEDQQLIILPVIWCLFLSPHLLQMQQIQFERNYTPGESWMNWRRMDAIKKVWWEKEANAQPDVFWWDSRGFLVGIQVASVYDVYEKIGISQRTHSGIPQ